MAQCNDPTDTFANIIYFRSWPIIYSTGPFPIEDLAANLANIRNAFGVIGVVTSGPNGDSFYEGTSYQDAVGRGYTPPNPPPVGTIGDGGGITCFGPVPCPTGQHWDLEKNMCVPDQVLEIPPVVPAAPPDPDPDPDEEQQGWEITWGYLWYIVQVIAKLLNQPPPSGGQSDCCAAVVAAVTSVTSALSSIAAELPKLSTGGPPPNLAPIVTELTCLCDSLKAIATAPPLDLTPVVDAINGIRDALPGPDPCVCDQLKLLTISQPDLAAENKALVDYAVANGIIDATLGQIIE